MPRVCANQARKLLAEAVQECETIPSLAQVVLAINEAGHAAVICTTLSEGCPRLYEAIRLIHKNTGIRVR